VATLSRDAALIDALLRFFAFDMLTPPESSSSSSSSTTTPSSSTVSPASPITLPADTDPFRLVQRAACFIALLFTCFRSLSLSSVIDLAWSAKLSDYALPFIVGRSDVLERHSADVERRLARTEETVALLVSAVGGSVLAAAEKKKQQHQPTPPPLHLGPPAEEDTPPPAYHAVYGLDRSASTSSRTSDQAPGKEKDKPREKKDKKAEKTRTH
jgi:hypothetical protein